MKNIASIVTRELRQGPSSSIAVLLSPRLAGQIRANLAEIFSGFRQKPILEIEQGPEGNVIAHFHFDHHATQPTLPDGDNDRPIAA